MSEEFAVCCMGIFCGHVDVGRAAKMYVQNPLERTGDLEQGFSYWIPGPNVEHLVRVDVQPMSRTGAARV